jgi:hypothetical protein
MIKNKPAFVLTILGSLIVSCSLTPQRMTFLSLESHVGDIERVSVSGCVIVTSLGAPAMFSTCRAANIADPSEAIDLGFGAKSGPRIHSGEFVCLQVVGRFYDLSDQAIVTGPGFGSVGLLAASNWKVLDCDE